MWCTNSFCTSKIENLCLNYVVDPWWINKRRSNDVWIFLRPFLIETRLGPATIPLWLHEPQAAGDGVDGVVVVIVVIAIASFNKQLQQIYICVLGNMYIYYFESPCVFIAFPQVPSRKLCLLHTTSLENQVPKKNKLRTNPFSKAFDSIDSEVWL